MKKKDEHYTGSFWGMLVIESQCEAEMQTSKTTLSSFKFNLSTSVLVFDSF